MKFLHILSCLALLFFNSCTKESQLSEGEKEQEKPELISDSSNESENAEAQSEATFFNPQLDFSILDISRPHDYPSSLDDSSICEGWELSENEITEIIRGAQEISGVLWDFSFDHLPCNHRAILVQGQKEYNLSLNGGSWMSISSPDSSIRMGVFDKKFEPYFLSEPAREEEH